MVRHGMEPGSSHIIEDGAVDPQLSWEYGNGQIPTFNKLMARKILMLWGTFRLFPLSEESTVLCRSSSTALEQGG